MEISLLHWHAVISQSVIYVKELSCHKHTDYSVYQAIHNYTVTVNPFSIKCSLTSVAYATPKSVI